MMRLILSGIDVVLGHFEEPPAPRRLNKAVPVELETIVLKAIEKNPAERYLTAQELADDLRGYLEDRPLHAQRPTFALRTRKWAKRHRAVVAALALLFLATVLSAVLIFRAYTKDSVAHEGDRPGNRVAEQVDGPAKLPGNRAVAAWPEGTFAGQEWDGNSLKMKFCWCPPGKFTMAAPRTNRAAVMTKARLQ